MYPSNPTLLNFSAPLANIIHLILPEYGIKTVKYFYTYLIQP